MTAEEWYLKGADYQRRGDFQQAINCYIEAVGLDPDSPAREAKAMLDDIFSFYNKDAYNP